MGLIFLNVGNLHCPNVSREVYCNTMKLDNGKKIYIETYGCQMNVADTEVVLGVMSDAGYRLTGEAAIADLILINTCSVRDNAEQRAQQRVSELKEHKRRNPEVLIGGNRYGYDTLFPIGGPGSDLPTGRDKHLGVRS